MLNTNLKASDWLSFEEAAPIEYGAPYWFKKENGNIILCIYASTGGATGWAEVHVDESGGLSFSANTFHILRGATLQKAII